MRRYLLVPLLLAACALAWAQADLTLASDKSKYDFVVYGDARFTDPADQRASNPEVRRALVDRIADLRPAFLVLTGDLVLSGGNAADWKVWDAETKPLRDAGLPILPVLGNHDLRGDHTAANFFARFPALKQRRWSTVRYGNTLVVLLDSESDAPGGPQWQWLQQQLSQVPADVDFLVVALHHPPYTNSSEKLAGGGHSAREHEQKLAALLEERQRALRQKIIVVAGHVHNYERYEHGGVMYIVAGGGGATPYEIKRGPQDFYREPGPTYHYLRFLVQGQKLRAEMVKFDRHAGKPQWNVKDSFELEVPRAAKAAAR